MKKQFVHKVIALVLTLGLSMPVLGAPVAKVPTHSKNYMKYNGKNVNYIKLTMDESVKVDLALANNKINSAQNLQALAKSEEGFAAINGTYFSAYNGDMPLPFGTVIKDGKLLHKSTVGATIGFTEDNRVLMDYLDIYIAGYTNGVKNWYAWNVNRPTTSKEGVILYTEEYKGNVDMPQGSVGVVVQGNKVLKHVTQTQSVPQNGFIVVYYPSVAHVAEKLPVGAEVTYKPEFTGTYTKSEDWDQVVTAISAGPSMILEGNVTNKPKEEGFTEAKITDNPATRSFIGFKEPNQLIIGTVNSATINDMVKIAQSMGLKSAMCLDGGGSTSLYYQGSYVSGPGRDLNNALVFSKATAEEQAKKIEARP